MDPEHWDDGQAWRIWPQLWKSGACALRRSALVIRVRTLPAHGITVEAFLCACRYDSGPLVYHLFRYGFGPPPCIRAICGPTRLPRCFQTGPDDGFSDLLC